MMTPHHAPTSDPRVTVLFGRLRQLRVRADLHSTSATIHHLRNCVLTAQIALRLVETRVAQGRTEEIDSLLDLAEARLRDGQALMTRSDLANFGPRRQLALEVA